MVSILHVSFKLPFLSPSCPTLARSPAEDNSTSYHNERTDSNSDNACVGCEEDMDAQADEVSPCLGSPATTPKPSEASDSALSRIYEIAKLSGRVIFRVFTKQFWRKGPQEKSLT